MIITSGLEWQAQLPAHTPAPLGEWLTSADSLTQRLRALGELQVHVIAEYRKEALPEESLLLGIPQGTKLWQRDVVLLSNNIPVVVAHSTMPFSALNDPHLHALKTLGNRPLGEIIFTELKGERERFEFCCLTRAHSLFKLAEPYIGQEKNLYARRSLIKILSYKLLINEVFLPFFERNHYATS